jgi:excisionase family DNA binding protein
LTDPDPQLDPNDPLLTVPEIAKQLRMSEWTIREWIKAGRLRGFRAGTRNYRIHRSELERFLRDRGAEPGAELPSPTLEDVSGSLVDGGLKVER